MINEQNQLIQKAQQSLDAAKYFTLIGKTL
jgi:hypothetical protein